MSLTSSRFLHDLYMQWMQWGGSGVVGDVSYIIPMKS